MGRCFCSLRGGFGIFLRRRCGLRLWGVSCFFLLLICLGGVEGCCGIGIGIGIVCQVWVFGEVTT